MTNTNTQSPSSKRPLWVVLVVIVIAVGTLTVLELTNTTYFFHKRPITTAGPNTKGIPKTNNNQATTTTPGTNNNSTTTGSISSNTAPLLTPTGPFISSHHQSLSQDSLINSVCNTTSGAICEIDFTQGSVTKSLPAQMTDAGGATYWNGWKLADIDLTTGDWQITAKATLGTQTQTASDAIVLTVTQ